MIGALKRIGYVFGCAALLQFVTSTVLAQNCDVDFPGTTTATFSAACGVSSNLTLGKSTYMGNGDTFTFNAPSTININGNMTVNAQGSGKIIIPAGVTVNISGNFNLNQRNGGCSQSSPCAFEIVVNGTLRVSNNFQNSLQNLSWSGTGDVIVDHRFANDPTGCMKCGATGCPSFSVDTDDCNDQGQNCSGSDFCTALSQCSPDVLSPEILGCPSNITVNSDPGKCTKVVTWTAPTASDNCMLAEFKPNAGAPASGSPFPVGKTTITYTAKDGQGNIVTCSFDVTVNDTEPPVITCPANITVNADPGQCTKKVSWPTPVVTDNCTALTPTSVPASGSAFPIGKTTVVVTALDNHGNKSTCSFDVIVNDAQPPVITACPANITVNADPGQCSKVVTWNPPSASDNCAVKSLTADRPSGSSFPVGKTMVKYTALDNAGNNATCSFEVLVKSIDLPLITGCPENISIDANEDGFAYPRWIPPTATATCGDAAITSLHQPGDPFEVGTTTVEYIATDAGGNTTSCVFDVVVNAFNEENINITIGKVITPNGDGVNDRWTITNIEAFKDNDVEVVDRWGSVVYKATGYDNASVSWGGANRGGQLVPTGTYFYTIVIDNGSKRIRETGFVEVIR